MQGKANPIRNHYNAVTVQTVETAANGRRLVMEARAYDDGVAFRYVVPEQPSVKELRILNESTQFRFSKDANTFSLISRGFQTSNEDDYHELTIGGLHPEYLVNLPLLLEVPGIAWVGLTEADIEDYSSLFVTARRRPGPGGPAGAPRRGHQHQRGRRPLLRSQGGRVEGVGDRANPREIVLARVDDRGSTRTAGGIEHGGQSESAQRHRRHFLDQARQDLLGLVERRPGQGRGASPARTTRP